MPCIPHSNCDINIVVFLAIIIDCRNVSQGLLALGDFFFSDFTFSFEAPFPFCANQFVSIRKMITKFVSMESLDHKPFPLLTDLVKSLTDNRHKKSQGILP